MPHSLREKTQATCPQTTHRIHVLDCLPTDWRQYSDAYVLLSHRPVECKFFNKISQQAESKTAILPVVLYHVTGNELSRQRLYPAVARGMEFSQNLREYVENVRQGENKHVDFSDYEFAKFISFYTGHHPQCPKLFARYIEVHELLALLTGAPSPRSTASLRHDYDSEPFGLNLQPNNLF